jgi:hypothetical protein
MVRVSDCELTIPHMTPVKLASEPRSLPLANGTSALDSLPFLMRHVNPPFKI